MPNGVIQTLSSYICNGGAFLTAKYVPKYQLRGAWIIFGIIIGMIAAILLYTLPTTSYHGRLAAMYVSYFYLGPYIVSLSLVGANTAVSVSPMAFSKKLS